jgi:hypothetical protein
MDVFELQPACRLIRQTIELLADEVQQPAIPTEHMMAGFGFGLRANAVNHDKPMATVRDLFFPMNGERIEGAITRDGVNHLLVAALLQAIDAAQNRRWPLLCWRALPSFETVTEFDGPTITILRLRAAFVELPNEPR